MVDQPVESRSKFGQTNGKLKRARSRILRALQLPPSEVAPPSFLRRGWSSAPHAGRSVRTTTAPSPSSSTSKSREASWSTVARLRSLTVITDELRQWQRERRRRRTQQMQATLQDSGVQSGNSSHHQNPGRTCAPQTQTGTTSRRPSSQSLWSSVFQSFVFLSPPSSSVQRSSPFQEAEAVAAWAG